MDFLFIYFFNGYYLLNSAAKPPNRKWTHISDNLLSIDMKRAVSANSHALDIMTSSFHGNSGLLGCVVCELY